MSFLDAVSDECFAEAYRRAVTAARTNLADTQWAIPKGTPFRLIALRRETNSQGRSVPQRSFYDTDQDFINGVWRWAQRLLLGKPYYEGPADFVPAKAGLALSVIAPLKACTVGRTGRALHALVNTLVELQPGDTRTFGGLPLDWRDPFGDVHPLIVAGTGGHPLADMHAAEQFGSALTIATARHKVWQPKVIPSSSFVLQEAPTSNVNA
jgi:hypothetical protein